jgi:antitoxin component of MazEF toxin-antitoxin module
LTCRIALSISYDTSRRSHRDARNQKDRQSTGIILPKELLAQLDPKQGDQVTASLLPEGGLKPARAEETFDEGLQIARKAMRPHRTTLKELLGLGGRAAAV